MNLYDDNIATWTRGVLAKRGIVSARQAEIKVKGGLSYATIQNMMNGKRVDVELFIKFTRAFEEDVLEALRTCGYEEIVNVVELYSHEEPKGNHTSAELTREEVYDDLPPELQKVVGMYSKVVNALPPGKQRDQYVASLEAQAESNWALLEARDKEDEENKTG